MFWTIFPIIMAINGALAPLPQAVRSIKRKCSKGVSKWLIIMWMLDRALSLCYVIHIGDSALVFKYAVGLFLISIIGFYKMVD